MHRVWIFQKKGLLMSKMQVATVRTQVTVNSKPSSVYKDEILDWDVPLIDAHIACSRIRVRIREAEAEPMLDA